MRDQISGLNITLLYSDGFILNVLSNCERWRDPLLNAIIIEPDLHYFFSCPNGAMFDIGWKRFDVTIWNIFVDGIVLNVGKKTRLRAEIELSRG